MTTARDLTLRLADLLRGERAVLAAFLLTLADFDRGRLWADLGHASLFSFLHRELGLSKAAAFYRKQAAELLQRVPAVIEPLRDGRLCFTSVVELAKVLTAENCEDVLPRFFHLSKQEAKAVSAELRPQVAAPRRDVVTVPTPGTAARATAEAPLFQVCTSRVHLDEPPGVSVTSSAPAVATPRPPPAPPRDAVEPLTADLRRLHFTVSRRFLEKLEAAKAALSHSHPGATAEEILEAGLDLVLARHAQRRGLVKRPRKVPPPSKPTHVPAHVGAAIWKRDRGMCRWALASGEICGSTYQVEIDHVNPKALGGQIRTPEEGRVLCKAHNDEAARLVFGDEWMNRYTRGLRGRRKATEHTSASTTDPPPVP